MIATVTQSSTELNEGGTVSFFVSTSGVANYTELYYTTEDEIDGTIKESDFISNSLSGPFQIFNDEGSIDVTVSRDRITEGTERFLIKIRETSITGTVVGISTLIRINDTSRAPSINASGKTFGPIQVLGPIITFGPITAPELTYTPSPRSAFEETSANS